MMFSLRATETLMGGGTERTRARLPIMRKCRSSGAQIPSHLASELPFEGLSKHIRGQFTNFQTALVEVENRRSSRSAVVA
jgi:hypothetical protein